ncbi:substrate-binding domain-containing protein [bacterium]|nr:substrate-binding domain-containing protein [bacterium]
MPFSRFRHAYQYNPRYYISLAALFGLLIAGFVIGLILSQQPAVPDTGAPATALILMNIIIFIFGSLFLVFLAWLRMQYNMNISEDMIFKLQEVTETDIKSLSNAMSELAHGNLSPSLRIQAEQADDPDGNTDLFYMNMLNGLIAGLHASAQELNILTDIPCYRLCYVGSDSFLEGRKCGEVMGNLLEGHGDVIIMTGSFEATHLELRRKGFENAIRNNFPRIRIAHIYDDHENPEETHRYAIKSIEELPHLRGFYVTHGATPHEVARAVKDRNLNDKIKIVCHDLTDPTMNSMSQGLISATLGQDPYAQGYNPVILLFNYLMGTWKPFAHRMLTRMDVVTPENYQMYWHPEQGLLQTQDALARLVKPAEKVSETPLRIAVLCNENSAFWIPVKEGVLHAGQELLSHNATVEWIVPEPDPDIAEGELFCRKLQFLIDQKYDAIATIALDRKMISIINKAIKSGIPVITFNSDPISLQGLIMAISDQASKLLNFSNVLISSTKEADDLTLQIKNAMEFVSDASVTQNDQVTHTQTILETLLENIDQVSRATEDGAKATANTSAAINEGAFAMEKTLNLVKHIENAVTETGRTVEKLGEHSERIDSVIDMIQDITSRVKVLALNASIEATQAGEEGQGFMVVANEVRRLAGNASNTTQEITTLINRVKQDIGEIEEVMHAGLDKVKQSAQQTTEAQTALQEIRSMIQVDQGRIKKMADAIAEIQTYSYRVEDAMRHVTEVSNRNKQSVQDVDKSTLDMISQLNQVNQLSSVLELMAQSELELLGKFNVSISEVRESTEVASGS